MTDRDKTYNGWRNYATWRVNLEMFDGQSGEDVTGDKHADADTIAECLQDQAESLLGELARGVALDYAMSFIADVDWQEIAEHMVEEPEAEDAD